MSSDASDQSRLERRVPDSGAGQRLDRFLADQPEVAARSVAKRLVTERLVEVDGQVVTKASTPLEPGQVVRFDEPQFEAEGEDPNAPTFELKILFEDAYLLVIDKPPGLIAHPPVAARAAMTSVASLALAHCGTLPTISGEDRPGIVHRLDKDTSGVMVVPKTDEAFHFVKSQFKGRTTEKEYRAIAYGEARFDSDFIERRIGVHPNHGDRMTVLQEGGKEAATYYEVVERFRGFTDFRCKPKTGRTHQIRVHMTSIGHSLVGDRVYRSRNLGSKAWPAGAPDPGRQCLHAERLGLQHPRTHEKLRFEAPVPEDMQRLIRWLRANR